MYFIDDTQKCPNILLNGDMALAQRGTSLAITGTGNGYIIDRWLAYETVMNGTISQQTSGSLAGLPNFLRAQRNSGNTGVGVMSIAQNVETPEARKYQGRWVTFSFWARAGANFSGASNSLGVQVFAGTGTDESVRTGYTGSSTALNTNVILTTSFQQFVFSVLIPSNSTEFAPVFSYTTVGTAGVNDYFDITGVMMTEGGLQPYRSAGGNFEAELAMCQRFYQLFGRGISGYSKASGVGWEFAIRFAVVMRAIPTMALSPGIGSLSVIGYPTGGQAHFTAASPVFNPGGEVGVAGTTRDSIDGFSGLPVGIPCVIENVTALQADAEIY